MIRTLLREQFIAGQTSSLWEFFAAPRNLDTLTPPSMKFEIMGPPPGRMYAGQVIEYRVGLLPGISTRWLTEITHVVEGSYFVDEQRIGPYKLWHHEHRFVPSADGRGVQMSDKITYDVGRGPLGDALHALWIQRQLKTIFDFRAQKVSELFPR